MDLPETLLLAAAYEGDTVEVLADWTWTGWDRIQSLDGYAHLFIKEATSRLPNQGPATSPPAGTMVGTYTADVDIFSLQYRVAF